MQQIIFLNRATAKSPPYLTGEGGGGGLGCPSLFPELFLVLEKVTGKSHKYPPEGSQNATILNVSKLHGIVLNSKHTGPHTFNVDQRDPKNPSLCQWAIYVRHYFAFDKEHSEENSGAEATLKYTIIRHSLVFEFFLVAYW